LTANHWQGDLPTEQSHQYLETLKEKLSGDGWDFETPGRSKILMLTHRVLATEQGYQRLLRVFPNNDALVKKEDPYIAFFVDVVEPACSAYERKKYGEMVAAVGGHLPRVHSQAEKERLAREMDELVRLRATGTVGDVLDCIERSRIRLPNAIERTERGLNLASDEATAIVERAREMRSVSYKEVLALERFINGHTPFATKHGVKGAEFENVLVVIGRGWNQYDFAQMLEMYGREIPPTKQESFERNRNLFYVACSRARRRLALLFTQKLPPGAIATLEGWFGGAAIHAM
jgi:DNA helicase-2/ATP-dependent DNA helicase PcrA